MKGNEILLLTLQRNSKVWMKLEEL